MSLQKQLLIWIMAILLCVATLAGGFAFWHTFDDINKLQRNNLKNIAMLFASAPPRPPRVPELTLNQPIERILPLEQNGRIANPRKPVDIPHHIQEQLEDNSQSEISRYDSKNDGQLRVHIIPVPLTRLRPHHLQHLQEHKLLSLPEGFGKLKYKDDEWLSFRVNQPNRIIIVRQKASIQQKLAITGGLQAFLPVLLSLLALLGLLPFVIKRMFEPVNELSEQIQNRDEQDLRPIGVTNDGKQIALPSEIQPLVLATNQMFKKVDGHITRQQRFVADSAHELRSPLTAISLQVQRLQRMLSGKELSNEQVENVRHGVDKLAVRVSHNQHLVEQLLTLARADAQKLMSAKTDIMPVFSQAIMLLLPIADNKQIELAVDNKLEGTEGEELSKQVDIDETSLMMVLKNLLQNAILYTPEKGKVSVNILDTHSLVDAQANLASNSECQLVGITTNTPIGSLLQQPKRLVIQICDTGMGIDVHNYQEVFTPFVRISNNTDAMRSDTAVKQAIETKGTGLGLAIVKQICGQAGVDVYLSATTDNKLDKGLTVTLVFSGSQISVTN